MLSFLSSIFKLYMELFSSLLSPDSSSVWFSLNKVDIKRISIGHSHYTVAMEFFVSKFTFVGKTIRLFAKSVSMTLSFYESAFIAVSSCCGQLTVSIGDAFFKFTRILLSIRHYLDTMTGYSAIFEFTFKALTVWPYSNAFSVWLATCEHAFSSCAVSVCENTFPFTCTIFEVTFKFLSIWPGINTRTVH